MATHSSILAGEFHGQRHLAGQGPRGHKKSDTTEQLALSLYLNQKSMPIYKDFRKIVLMIPRTGKQRRHRCKEETFRLSGRRRGWDYLRRAMKHIHYYTYIKQITSAVRCLRQGAQCQCCDNLEGQCVSGVQDGGTCVCLWLIHVDVWPKPSQYYKVTIL